MKILLISDNAPYSTKDVYDGYCRGLDSLKIPFEVVYMPGLLELYSAEIAWSLVISKALIKENEFTHVIFVAGTQVPKWVIESMYDKQVAIIGTDDPHSSNITMKHLPVLKYYFSCERNMSDPKQKVHYLPTACSDIHLNAQEGALEPSYQSDLCFVGSVYPNRVRGLEGAVRWAIKNKKKILILGHTDCCGTDGVPYLPKDSIVRKYSRAGTVENEETIKYYRGAKVVINMDRDVTWDPLKNNNENDHLVPVVPYSGNPRMYEIAAIGSIQLYVDARPEAKDLFGDNVYTCSSKNIKKMLDEIFNESEEVLNDKIKKCREIVADSHTYTNRCAKMIKILIKH